VNGTVGALTSALKEPNIKRVVITSSVVALEPKDGNVFAGRKCFVPKWLRLRANAQILAANDVRVLPPPEFMKSVTQAPMAYVFSKTLAHRAVNDWITEHPDAHFDVVRVLPAYTQGANELATTPEGLGEGSNEGVYNLALGNILPFPKPSNQVYLDDVAQAHVTALNRGKVPGGRVLIIVSNNGQGWDWDEWVEVVERLYPEEVKKGVLKPKKGQQNRGGKFDISETVKTLGWEFRGKEEMVRSVVGQYLELKAAQA
jgi:nucleoside-diphosphate-sugar epimerase